MMTRTLKKTLLTLLLAVPLAGLAGCKKKEVTLNLLVWEGYADPSFLRAFEQEHGCKITASYMGSSDELIAKLRGGSAGTYDVISPSSDVATTITTTGLAAPLDLSKIPAYAQLSTRLREMPLVKKDGKVYGVPFVWGPNPLIYDTTAFPKAPESWAVLWDPAHKGKVSIWDDLSSVYLAGQVLGMDQPPEGLYNMTDEQLAKVKAKLLELKPNVRKMWTTGGELINLFQNKEVVVAMGWPYMTNQLKKSKFPIGEVIPKENTTGWIDHLMITAASQNKELAHKFLAYMVSAKAQKLVTDVTGYTPANSQAAQLMTEEERRGLHLDDVDNYQKRIYFWQHVPRRDKYNEIWNQVKAAQ